MKLVVSWQNSTRPHIERVQVEDEVQKAILDYFGGSVENARKANCHGSASPFDDWSRAVYYGYRSIKGKVSPCEYARLAFKVTFEEGLK